MNKNFKINYVNIIIPIISIFFFLDLLGMRVGGMNIFYVIFPILIIFLIAILFIINNGKIQLNGITSYYLLLLIFFFYISFINASFISLRYSILIAVWFVMYLVITQVLANISSRKESVWFFLKAINITLFMFILASIINHIFFGQFFRLYGLNYGLGPNEIALYCTAGIIITAQLFNKYNNVHYLIIGIVFFMALILTGSRTSILALMIISLFISLKIIISLKSKMPKRYIKLLIIILILSPFLTYASGIIILRFYIEIVGALALSDNLLTNVYVTSYRLQGIFVAKEILLENLSNFTIGVGFENYRVTYSHILEKYFDGSTMSIHSVYLQILVGGGFTSLILFLLYIQKLISTSLKIKDKILKNTVLYLIALNLIYMLFGSTFVNRQIYFIIPVLVYLASKKRKLDSQCAQ